MTNNTSTLGFNGAYLDSTLDNYHLGNGYRAYNPAIMAFTAPDDMSPFGHGGINPYVYVSCDPINNTDPTGHFNILGFVSSIALAAFSIVSMGTAILATVASGGGLSLPALGVIAGSAYGIYSGITQAIEATHKNDSIGKQLVNFGINAGITIAAELGGAALGATIKSLAPETSALLEGAVGKVTGRIVSRESAALEEIELNSIPRVATEDQLASTEPTPQVTPKEIRRGYLPKTASVLRGTDRWYDASADLNKQLQIKNPDFFYRKTPIVRNVKYLNFDNYFNPENKSVIFYIGDEPPADLYDDLAL